MTLIGRHGGCDAVSLIAFQVVLRLLLPRSILTSERGESSFAAFQTFWAGSRRQSTAGPPEETEFGARQLACLRATSGTRLGRLSVPL